MKIFKRCKNRNCETSVNSGYIKPIIYLHKDKVPVRRPLLRFVHVKMLMHEKEVYVDMLQILT